LSPVERTSIASRAALARWSSQGSSSLMKSVRLDQPNLEDPVYLEELLLEGSLEDWRRLYQKIMNEPFGSTAQTLQRTLSSTHIYGVTALWKGIFRGLQGNFL
ncbi:MAG: hypothetical protein HY073_04410, partial [Deltaproteobacteria bacterium]|nr:hypothetical protein [Deltaproteobacteria bacterium]